MFTKQIRLRPLSCAYIVYVNMHVRLCVCAGVCMCVRECMSVLVCMCASADLPVFHSNASIDAVTHTNKRTHLSL